MELRIYGVPHVSKAAVDELAARAQPALDRVALGKFREDFLDEFFQEIKLQPKSYRSLPWRLARGLYQQCGRRLLGSLPVDVAEMDLDVDDLALFLDSHPKKPPTVHTTISVPRDQRTPRDLAAMKRCLLSVSWGADDDQCGEGSFYVARPVNFVDAVASQRLFLKEQRRLLFVRNRSSDDSLGERTSFDDEDSKLLPQSSEQQKVVFVASKADVRGASMGSSGKKVDDVALGDEFLALVEIRLTEDTVECRFVVLGEPESFVEWVQSRVQGGLDDALVETKLLSTTKNFRSAADAVVSSGSFIRSRLAKLAVSTDVVPAWSLEHVARAAKRDCLHLQDGSSSWDYYDACEVQILESDDDDDDPGYRVIAVWRPAVTLNFDMWRIAVIDICSRRRSLATYNLDADHESLGNRLSATARRARRRQRRLDLRLATETKVPPGPADDALLPPWWRSDPKEAAMIPEQSLVQRKKRDSSTSEDNLVATARVVIVPDAVPPGRRVNCSDDEETEASDDDDNDEVSKTAVKLRRRALWDPGAVIAEGVVDEVDSMTAMAWAAATALAFVVSVRADFHRALGTLRVVDGDDALFLNGWSCKMELAARTFVARLTPKLENDGALTAELTVSRIVASDLFSDPQATLERWLQESVRAFQCRCLIAAARSPPMLPSARAVLGLVKAVDAVSKQRALDETKSTPGSSAKKSTTSNAAKKATRSRKLAAAKGTKRGPKTSPSSSQRRSPSLSTATSIASSMGVAVDHRRVECQLGTVGGPVLDEALPVYFFEEKTSEPSAREDGTTEAAIESMEEERRTAAIFISATETDTSDDEAPPPPAPRPGLQSLFAAVADEQTRPGPASVTLVDLDAFGHDGAIACVVTLFTTQADDDTISQTLAGHVIGPATQPPATPTTSFFHKPPLDFESHTARQLMERDDLVVDACSRRGLAALGKVEAQFAKAKLYHLQLPTSFFRTVKPYLARAPLGCWFPDFGNCIHNAQFDAFVLGSPDKFEAIVRANGSRVAFFETDAQRTWLVSLRGSLSVFALRFRVFFSKDRRARAEVVAATIGPRPSPVDDDNIRRFAIALRDAVHAPEKLPLSGGEQASSDVSSDDAISLHIDSDDGIAAAAAATAAVVSAGFPRTPSLPDLSTLARDRGDKSKGGSSPVSPRRRARRKEALKLAAQKRFHRHGPLARAASGLLFRPDPLLPPRSSSDDTCSCLFRFCQPPTPVPAQTFVLSPLQGTPRIYSTSPPTS